MTFEEYLQGKHAIEYEGFNDDMLDNFLDWLGELEPDAWLEYAEEWKKEWEDILASIKEEI